MTTAHLRWMVTRDIDDVLLIEADSCGLRWQEDDFRKVLAGTKTISKVAEISEDVVGFICWQVGERSIKILNIAVRASLQRQGIGRQLIDNLLTKIGRKRKKIVVNVRESNLAAQLFFKGCGFLAVAVKQKMFYGPREAGYVFEYRLPESIEEIEALHDRAA